MEVTRVEYLRIVIDMLKELPAGYTVGQLQRVLLRLLREEEE